ncbi:hypothetical protein, partial [Schaalia hyovaginalis]|uniref:hypothetical protein n=1 Tax=Schaalia hyovaginalis TaxID=29316 RepID=UPI001F1DD9B7
MGREQREEGRVRDESRLREIACALSDRRRCRSAEHAWKGAKVNLKKSIVGGLSAAAIACAGLVSPA